MSDAGDILTRRAAETSVKVTPGATSYFEQPTRDYDPRLFAPGSTRLQPYVRQWIIERVHQFWAAKGYHQVDRWAVIWIAGSGITHQWSAARSPADLDVLIGVDFTEFRITNPRFQGWDEVMLAQRMNDEFRAELDPLTDNWSGFEVTFYVNPGAADIRSIVPYAAYNVTADEWTVRPIDLPADWSPHTYLPPEYERALAVEDNTARGLINTFGTQQQALSREGDPGRRRNLAVQLRQTLTSASGLFNSIHLDRRKAFSQGGGGYKDYYNYRWQAHKQSGVVPALHTLASLHSQVQQEEDLERYGQVVTGSNAALAAAASANAIMGALAVRR
jgi:hypothetical protein